ncbi:unnamed protein product, partial [Meganyctiphanes norvegica]
MLLHKYEVTLLLVLFIVALTVNAIDDSGNERQGCQAKQHDLKSKIYSFVDAYSGKICLEDRKYINIVRKENTGHCDKHNNLFKKSKDHLNILDTEINLNNSTQNKERNGQMLDQFSSSVWCQKSLESGLRCHFHNLCYLTHIREFAFVFGSNSIIYGISNIKTLSDNLFMSSLIDHNHFSFPLSLVPAKAVPSNKKLINSKTLIMARFKPDNLLHTFHDDLLPAYFTIKEICNYNPVCEKNINIFLSDENEMAHWNLFKTVSDKIIVSSKLSKDETWVCFKESYIGLNKMSVWYHYGFDKPQGPILNENFFGHNLDEYVVHTLNELSIYDKKEENDAITGIILSRHNNRKIINEVEVSHEIKRTLTKFYKNENIRIKIMSLEKDSIQDIIHEISHAKILVGMHGSALILGIFLSKDSVLIELWPYGVNPSAATVIRTLCSIKGITYASWVNYDFQNTIPHPEYPPHYGGLNHLPKPLQEKILRELQTSELSSVICCDNPNWLFRIYQDTEVLIETKLKGHKSEYFQKVVLKSLKQSEIHMNKNFNKVLKLMFPSKVISLNCHITKSTNQRLQYIQWQAPWNLQHLGCIDISYEVTQQNMVPGKGIDTSRSKFKDDVTFVSAWVTCVCDGNIGPDVYVLC